MRAFLAGLAFLLFPGIAWSGDMSPSDMAAGSMHAEHMAKMAAAAAASSQPKEPGQAAFAALAEIVAILDRDPATDWSKVDIEALRQHLIDMNNVTLGAEVAASPAPGGMRFAVTGAPAVEASIRRMVTAHAATMSGTRGWSYAVDTIDHGAALTVTTSEPNDIVKLKALSFIGIMTIGMHHQAHHLMIASGHNPHR